MVVAISILVSTVVFAIWPVSNPILRFLAHLLMLPLIVGISYEFNRWAGRHDGPVTRVLTAPGLWLQNFTTFEPDDSMMEVGIRALELVLPEVKGEGRLVECRMQECRMQNWGTRITGAHTAVNCKEIRQRRMGAALTEYVQSENT